MKGFSGNKIGDNFSNNKIGGDFTNNSIDDNFQNNDINYYKDLGKTGNKTKKKSNLEIFYFIVGILVGLTLLYEFVIKHQL